MLQTLLHFRKAFTRLAIISISLSIGRRLNGNHCKNTVVNKILVTTYLSFQILNKSAVIKHLLHVPVIV